MAARDRRIELRVGFFVMSALIIGGALAFMIGNQRSLWRSKTGYRVIFDDVAGLRPGGPVQLAGVDVGTVTDVEFLEDGHIEVTLGIVSEAKRLIRQDQRDQNGNVIRPGTEATIGSKGFLGDMQVNLSVGHGPPLDPATPIPVGAAQGIGAVLDQAGEISNDVKSVTEDLAEQEVGKNLAELLVSLREVSDLIAREDGTMQRLLANPETADQFNDALKNASTMSLEISRAARSARLIFDEIRDGDGGAHQLIYGQDSARLVASGADALGELATTLQSVRTSDGLAHELLYGSESGDIVENLESASSDIAAITRSIREGDGTLGALLTDPSVYEDVKRLVGNLERNEILRALVRYSISSDETQPARSVTVEE